MLGEIFNSVLYRPIFNVLVFLYNAIPGHDFGIAIILLTVVVRAILFPFSYKSTKARQALSLLQPKIKEIQQKYKNKEEQSRELMKAYKEHNVNPLSGCLTLLIQLPVLLALYRVLIGALNPENLTLVYPFIKNPGVINASLLGLVDLSKVSIVLTLLAAVGQFFNSKIMLQLSPPAPQGGAEDKSANIQNTLSKQMVFLGPILTILIGMKVPAGLTLYWLVFSLLGTAQDYWLLKKTHGKNEENN